MAWKRSLVVFRRCFSYRLLVACLAVVPFSGMAGTGEPGVCDITARSHAWPKTAGTPRDSVVLHTGPRLLMNVPAGMRKITHSGYEIHVRYPDGRLLVFQEHRIGDYVPARGRVKVVQIPFLLFDQTCRQWRNYGQGMLFRRFVNEKQAYLADRKHVYRAMRDGLITWYSPEPNKRGERFAVIVNRKYRWSFLVFTVTGVSKQAFFDILGSVKNF